MPSSEELLAKPHRWEAGFTSPPTLMDALNSGDVELFGAYLLRGFREAAKEAVGDRLVSEQKKLLGLDLRHGAAGRVADWIARAWGISEADELRLLDLVDPTSLVELRVILPEDARHETLERLAMLLDIYHALHTLLPKSKAADSWVRRPNNAPLCGGRTALNFMLERGREGIRDVRAYLWAQIWSV